MIAALGPPVVQLEIACACGAGGRRSHSGSSCAQPEWRHPRARGCCPFGFRYPSGADHGAVVDAVAWLPFACRCARRGAPGRRPQGIGGGAGPRASEAEPVQIGGPMVLSGQRRPGVRAGRRHGDAGVATAGPLSSWRELAGEVAARGARRSGSVCLGVRASCAGKGDRFFEGRAPLRLGAVGRASVEVRRLEAQSSKRSAPETLLPSPSDGIASASRQLLQRLFLDRAGFCERPSVAERYIAQEHAVTSAYFVRCVQVDLCGG